MRSPPRNETLVAALAGAVAATARRAACLADEGKSVCTGGTLDWMKRKLAWSVHA